MNSMLFITHTLSTGGGAEKILAALLEGISPYYTIDVIERKEDSTYRYKLPNITKLPSMSYTANAALQYRKNKLVQKTWMILFKIMMLIVPGLVYRIFIKKQYDYEISFNYLFTSFLVAHSKNKNSKKIMWIHGSIEDLEYKQYRGLKWIIYFVLFKHQQAAFKKSDVIIAISNRTKKSIISVYPECQEKIAVLYNGLDIKNIRKNSLVELAGPVLGKMKENAILGVGRLDRNKNFELLICSVSRIIHAGIKCSLVLVGEGGLQNKLADIAREQGIEEYVFFSGFQKNPYPYFNRSKIVCVSSFAEGFPTVILEALVLGKPFVTTPVAGASEELSDNGQCGLVADWDIEEYAECIRKLLVDNERYEIMAKNCLKKAEAYSTENFVHNFNQLIQKLDRQKNII